jgi:hypothetical protein
MFRWWRRGWNAGAEVTAKRFYAADFEALVKRRHKCININGGYVEKYFLFQVRISHVLRFISICVVFTDSPSCMYPWQFSEDGMSLRFSPIYERYLQESSASTFLTRLMLKILMNYTSLCLISRQNWLTCQDIQRKYECGKSIFALLVYFPNIGLCDLRPLCIFVYPHFNIWTPEPVFMKFGTSGQLNPT